MGNLEKGNQVLLAGKDIQNRLALLSAKDRGICDIFHPKHVWNFLVELPFSVHPH